jgi:hypothetical protein
VSGVIRKVEVAAEIAMEVAQSECPHSGRENDLHVHTLLALAPAMDAEHDTHQRMCPVVHAS